MKTVTVLGATPATSVDEVLLEAKRQLHTQHLLHVECDRGTARILRHVVDHLGAGRNGDAVRMLMSTIKSLES